MELLGDRKSGYPFLVKGWTRDISNKGAYLCVSPVFQVEQRVHLEMDIPPGAGQQVELKIGCEADVVRVDRASSPQKRSGMAVRILRFASPRVPAVSTTSEG